VISSVKSPVSICNQALAYAPRGAFSRALYRFREIVEQAERDGLWVLPACRDRAAKHPCLVGWSQFQERAPTKAKRAAWLANHPDRNGIYVTGPALGRFVLDCDSPAAIAWVLRKGLPKTQTMLTRKGRHYHFVYPKVQVKNSTGKIHKGVDIRGAGGVAVAAGSLHETGFRYAWAKGRSPQDVKLAKAPKWLLDWLRADGERRERVGPHTEVPPFDGIVGPWAARIIDEELETLREAIEGTRNDALAHCAFKLGQLAGGGEADGAELQAALCEIARGWPNEQKSFDTIARCFESGTSQPRVAPPSPVQELMMERLKYGW